MNSQAISREIHVIMSYLEAMNYDVMFNRDHIAFTEKFEGEPTEVTHQIRVYMDGRVISENLSICYQGEDELGNLTQGPVSAAVIQEVTNRVASRAHMECLYDFMYN